MTKDIPFRDGENQGYNDPKSLFEQEFCRRILADAEWSAWTDTLTEDEWDQYMDLALVFAGLQKPRQSKAAVNLKYRIKRGQRRQYKEFCHE